MLKRFTLKRFSLIATTFVMLISFAGSSYAAPSAGGELRVLFGINEDNSGFGFDGLTLDFNADLSAGEGVRGEFEYNSNGVDTIAHYYIKDVFRNDELNIGLFPIDWASDKSRTLDGSLSEKIQRVGGIAFPNDDGFEKGVGVKYKTSFEHFNLITSVSEEATRDFRDGTDIVGRGSFNVNRDLEIGVGLASINRAKNTDASDFGVLIDAGFDAGALDFLFEVLSVNSRHGGYKETNSGFYVEAAYEATRDLTLYGSFTGAKDITDDLIAAGFTTKITPHATFQGELQNTREDWSLALGLKVNF